MDQPTFRVQNLCDLVVLLEKSPPIPRVPVLLYRLWEYDGRNPRKRKGEENGELVEEVDVLILYMFWE